MFAPKLKLYDAIVAVLLYRYYSAICQRGLSFSGGLLGVYPPRFAKRDTCDEATDARTELGSCTGDFALLFGGVVGSDPLPYRSAQTAT